MQTLCFIAFGVFAPAVSAAALTCANLDRVNSEDLMKLGAAQHPDFDYAARGSGCYPPKGHEFECHWETSLKQDRILAPQRRLLLVNTDHRKGSGAWDYLMVFACIGNRPQLVLTGKFLYGIQLAEISANRITGRAGDWRKADPTCCPSHQQHLTYTWDKQQQRYRESAYSTPRVDP